MYTPLYKRGLLPAKVVKIQTSSERKEIPPTLFPEMDLYSPLPPLSPESKFRLFSLFCSEEDTAIISDLFRAISSSSSSSSYSFCVAAATNHTAGNVVYKKLNRIFQTPEVFFATKENLQRLPKVLKCKLF